MPPDGHRIDLIEGGDALFAALVVAIDAARREVYLETYIADGVGAPSAVAQALARAAMRGVAVHLVADGVGTPALPAAWVTWFAQTGVQWRLYRPVRAHWAWLRPRNWRRLHRKLVVVDAEVAFCGGINLLDDHWDLHHGALPAPRLDFALRVRGPLVADAQRCVQQFWWRMQVRAWAGQRDWAALQQALDSPDVDWRNWLRTPVRSAQTALKSIAVGDPIGGAIDASKAALVLRDNLLHRRAIERAYRLVLARARHEVWLAHAYFLPGRALMRQLLLARRRGVRVRLLLQGRVEYAWAHRAQVALLGRLLAAGVEVALYQASFLHAKVAVVDAAWVTVGSSNLDPLSLLLAKEANVLLRDTTVAATLGAALQRATDSGSIALDAQAYARRSDWRRALDALALAGVRLALFLTGKRY